MSRKAALSNFFWALAGAAALGAVMFVVFRFQSRETPSEQLALKAKKAELAGQIRLALASAAEAEKSAVLAITEQQARAFADRSRAATVTAENKRVALAGLLQPADTSKERDLLAQFSSVFSKFQQVDKELLDLAVKDTNLKATALAFGPAAQAMKEMDTALTRLLRQSASSTSGSAKEAMSLAAGAQAAALRIQVLLPPHIAEESDKKMDELEAVMAKQDEEVRRDLRELAALVPTASADLHTATSGYSRFMELRTRILKLSRENTNVRSLFISLNQKRRVTALCHDALAALQKAIEEEHVAAPARPR
jgi:hypothetical protein